MGIHNWVEEIEFNFTGRLKTFSCFWYQTIFLNDGLTIYPNKSLIFNTGNDGSGVNSGNNSRMDTKIFNGKIKKFVIPTSYSFFFKLNSKIFYNKNKIFKFFQYHRKKFTSFNNFKEYLKSKY